MRYTKMHGAGNSFVLTEDLRGELRGEDLHVLALRLCDGKSGPGADGLIVLRPAEGDEDFSMLFYNADASMGEETESSSATSEVSLFTATTFVISPLPLAMSSSVTT